MNDFLKYLLICLPAFALEPALGQSADTAAERSRLGNQRIYSEVEQRDREEQQKLEQARLQNETEARSKRPAVEEDPPPTGQRAMSAVQAEAAPKRAAVQEASAGKTDISRSLEQLRTLGELRDAGYVTEEEFTRIKQKILDAQF